MQYSRLDPRYMFDADDSLAQIARVYAGNDVDDGGTGQSVDRTPQGGGWAAECLQTAACV